MIAQLAEAVRSHFKSEMAKRLPAFEALARHSHNDVLVLPVSETLVFFVHLSIADSKDSFVLEIASNNRTAYPWTVMPGQVRDLSSAAAKDVWRFRIPKLWNETGEYWWVLGQALDRCQSIERLRSKTYSTTQDLGTKLNDVQSKIIDAVEKVCRYAVPYFELAALEHGYELKIELPKS